MYTQTFVSDGNFLLNKAPGLSGPDGVQLLFTISGTTSGVLAVNTAPPGSAVSLTNIGYLNGSLVAQAAGTAITASGLAYVSAADAALDLYLVLNWTSGETVVDVSQANIGGGGGSGGTVPAGDVTPGTFGASVGAGLTSTYAAPGILTSAGATAAIAQGATTSDTSFGTGTGTGQTTVNIRGAVDQVRALRLRAGTAIRMALGLTTSDTFAIDAYAAGVFVDAPVTINPDAGGSIGTAAGRSFVLGGTGTGTATSSARGIKTTTAIADNVATAIAVITVPNIAATASIVITAQGALGAGGAIGAREAMAQNSYTISIARTAGVAAVASISTAYGATATNVAGAATCTAAVTLSSVSGGVGATNTFNILITIIKNGGSSDNHTATVRWDAMNAAASGVSVA